MEGGDPPVGLGAEPVDLAGVLGAQRGQLVAVVGAGLVPVNPNRGRSTLTTANNLAVDLQALGEDEPAQRRRDRAAGRP